MQRESRPTLVLIATAVASGMGVVDTTAVNTALPVIQAQMGADAADAFWIMEGYLLFQCALMLVGGVIGDRFGRRRTFLGGVFAFALTSLACALSTGTLELVIARAFQGVAAAVLFPTSLSLLNASYPPEERQEATGRWVAIMAVLVVMGPPAGGAAVQFLDWTWIFLINLPLSVLAFVLAWIGVGEGNDANPVEGGLDWTGAVMTTLTLGGLTYGLLEAPHAGWSVDVIAAFAVAVLGFLAFLRIEATARNPMVPLELFRLRLFSGVNLLTLLFYGAFQGGIFFIPFMLIQVQGYVPLDSALSILPISIGISIMSRQSGRMVKKYGNRNLLRVGCVLAAAGFVLISQYEMLGDYWRIMFPGLCILSIGVGISITPITTLAINAAGPERSGMASGLNYAVSRIGMLLAVAGLGFALALVFKGEFQIALAGLALPEAALGELTAQSMRLAETPIPDMLDAGQASAVRGVIYGSYMTGFEAAMLTSAVLLLICAAIAAWMEKPKQRFYDPEAVSELNRPDGL